MERSGLSEQNRKRIEALIEADHGEGNLLLARLRELRVREGISACAAALRLIANLSRDESDAEELLEGIGEHRAVVAGTLGRDPGLHVAAVDFLANVKRVMRNPVMVERATLRRAELGAMTDPLTGMFNRRYFLSALELELRRSRRYSLALSLLMIDLDYFKSVNDIYGHPLGDRVLERAGHVVRQAVRESDVPCRCGGDEFAVILPETDRMGALAVGERIRERIRTWFAGTPIDQRLVAMTVSGGISCSPEDGTSPDKLVDRADRALYQAKSRGRNTIVIHHAERRKEIRFPVKSSTRAELVGGSGEGLGMVRPVNLSRGGVLVEARTERLPSGPVELMFWGEDDTWTAPGRVVRVEEDTALGRGRLVAVAFDRPLPDERLRHSVMHASASRPREGERV